MVVEESDQNLKISRHRILGIFCPYTDDLDAIVVEDVESGRRLADPSSASESECSEVLWGSGELGRPSASFNRGRPHLHGVVKMLAASSHHPDRHTRFTRSVHVEWYNGRQGGQGGNNTGYR